ncbi:hypothetical protein B0H14DRAFT_3614302 [Mycena olivaceomarginata]|nr:hypothetical protein B0H14DRAFT_3614302 [Mycena olivaceomarginata]
MSSGYPVQITANEPLWCQQHILKGLKVDDQEVNTSQLSISQSRVLHFAACIGWDETNNKYCFWDIPFLHGNESRTLDYNELFHHPLLLKVFICIIRGMAAAAKVMEKHAQLPKANVMQRMFNIKHTTPGAIASTAVWAIWLFSGDETFSETGDVTGINFYHCFNEYLDKILEGLWRRQKWAQDLFVFWDSHLFPETIVLVTTSRLPLLVSYLDYKRLRRGSRQWSQGSGDGNCNGSKFGGGVQAEDESVREELVAATTALVDMPVISDDNGDDDV